jgi:hypothetical protein
LVEAAAGFPVDRTAAAKLRALAAAEANLLTEVAGAEPRGSAAAPVAPVVPAERLADGEGPPCKGGLEVDPAPTLSSATSNGARVEAMPGLAGSSSDDAP